VFSAHQSQNGYRNGACMPPTRRRALNATYALAPASKFVLRAPSVGLFEFEDQPYSRRDFVNWPAMD